jgi:hypothetical protein
VTARAVNKQILSNMIKTTMNIEKDNSYIEATIFYMVNFMAEISYCFTSRRI